MYNKVTFEFDRKGEFKVFEFELCEQQKAIISICVCIKLQVGFAIDKMLCMIRAIFLLSLVLGKS